MKTASVTNNNSIPFNPVTRIDEHSKIAIPVDNHGQARDDKAILENLFA